MDTHSANVRTHGDHASRFGSRPGVEGLVTFARAEARGSEDEVLVARGSFYAITTSLGPRRREDLTTEVIDGDLLLFDPVTANTHHLNETAHVIWRMCDGTRTVADMAGALCEQFDVKRPDALRCAGDLVETLAAQGLLVGEGPPGSGSVCLRTEPQP